MPKGVEGEIYLSGTGLALGYLNNEDLTAQKFIESPFERDQKLYVSGDRGRWLDDGNIEFCGRIDNQVKIRGFRVELGEVEKSLMKHSGIEKCVATTCKDTGGINQLVAYVVGTKDLSSAELRTFIRKQLPEYMMPSHFIFLEALPLTINGKVDYDALPEPKDIQIEEDYVAPRNDVEQKIAKVWEDQLGRSPISVVENFFAVGGDSIKAIRIASAINKELGLSIEVKDLFSNQEIASLAEFVQGKTGNDEEQIRKAAEEIEAIKQAILEDSDKSKLLPETWEDFYPMTDIQRGMVFYTLLDITDGVYHDQMYFQIEDDSFDFEAFEKSFLLLAEKHSILRTSFHMNGFEPPIQVVHKSDSFSSDIQFDDISNLNENEQKQYLNDYLNEDRALSFDFTNAGIWRVRLFKLSHNEYGFLFVGHHAMIDGWSDASLRTELSNIYYHLKSDKSYKPEPINVTYKDYVIDQYYYSRSEDSITYWKTELDGYQRTDLPLHRSLNKNDKSKNYHAHSIFLDKELSTAIRDLSESKNISVKNICLSAFVYFMKVTTNSDDVTIGLLTNGRPSIEDADKMLGCFLNTVPFRQKIPWNICGDEFIDMINDHSLATKQYDKLSFQKIIEVIGEDTSSVNPVFDILFNFVDFHITDDVHEETQVKRGLVEGFGETNTTFDFIVNASHKEIEVSLCSYVELYSNQDFHRISTYYINIIKDIVYNGNKPLNNNRILGDSEREQLVYKLNDTFTDYPKVSIQQLFEEQVIETPEAAAIVINEQTITYQELNTKANQLAHFLLENYTIQPEKPIGVVLDKSERVVIALLAILKVGGTYVPIDSAYPGERIKMMIADVNVDIMLTDSDLLVELAAYYNGDIIALDVQLDAMTTPTHNLEYRSDMNSLAYIMYTSGSTGKPKGVMVEHKSIIRLVRNTNYVSIKPGMKLLQTGAISFDATTFEIWGTLLNGGELHLLNHDDLMNLDALKLKMHEDNIDIMWFTSSWLNDLVDQDITIFEKLDILLAGGDKLSTKHVSRLKNTYPNLTIINGYGPTENTTFSICKIIDKVDGNTIPLGQPIANSTVYILDSDMQPVPCGVIGEIYLGGDGLARGYWNNKALTVEMFVKNPFSADKKQKLYKTGDFGERLSNGDIDFKGRKDNQVKIRGFRIELGEVESIISSEDAVDKAYVDMMIDKTGEKQLVAYVTGDVRGSLSTIKDSIRSKLPAYMVPGFFVKLDAMPLTINGKLDKSRLPLPDAFEGNRKAVVEPENDIERELLTIWNNILGISQIGVTDNFFELGGHSLRATQLAYHVADKLGVKIELKDIFATPTIRELASIIDRSNHTSTERIEVLDNADFYDLSHAQMRVWLHCQKETDTSAYVIPAAFVLSENLNIPAFEKAMRFIMDRHESLRTSFTVVGGEPKQKINKMEDLNFSINHVEITMTDNEEEVIKDIYIDQITQKFDLANEPLVRVSLIKKHHGDHVLLFAMHHIISDGWSVGILFDELLKSYDAYDNHVSVSLEPLRIHYKDYAAWQNNLLSDVDINNLRQYWWDQFGDDIPELDLQTDHPRPYPMKYAGRDHAFKLDKQISSHANKICQEYGVSLFMFLLTATKVLLKKYSGQKDIVVGTPIAGREHVDLENQIGFYLNTLPLRSTIQSNDSFSEVLDRVKAVTMDAFEHQQYPFDKLVEDLDLLDYGSGRSPLFDVMVILQNMGLADTDRQDSSQLKISGYSAGNMERPTKYDLTFTFKETGNEIFSIITYNTSLFNPETIEKIEKDFRLILNGVLDNMHTKIGDIELMNQESNDFANAFID